MNLYEYQGKEVFSKNNIPVPKGRVAFNTEEVEKVAGEVGGPVVIKAQVKVGGRGKAGGVKFADSPQEAADMAKELMGKELKGLIIDRLLVEQKLTIQKEIYVGITIDRNQGKPIIMVSSEGGVEIEEVAKKSPEKIYSRHIEPFVGIYPYIAREFAAKLDLTGDNFKVFTSMLLNLYNVFSKYDAQIAEINPLVIAKEGMFAADSKLAIEDDALYRHKEFTPEDSSELPYVELEGFIGCIVNGAGLAMSTMDTLKHLGGEPANFLDIGGGASSEVMKKALTQVANHPKVKVIFINVLGGITRCDEIANGILGAIEEISVPIVVRFRGTNEKEGVEILKNAGYDVDSEMIKAAEKAIAMGKGA